MESTPHNIGIVAERLDATRANVTRLDQTKADKSEVTDIKQDISEIKQTVTGVQRILIGFILTSFTAALAFAGVALTLVVSHHP